MKNVPVFFLALATVVTLYSCGGSKETTKSEKFKEITIPCADKGKSSSKVFRANSSGTSRDLATSREKALVMTKQRLASLINSTLKSVTERYVNEMDVANSTEFEQSFENMTRDVVKQKLSDITITCEKVGKKDDGSYVTHLAIEVPKDAVLNDIDNGISKNKKLELMYDREKFRKKFEEEMDKLEREY